VLDDELGDREVAGALLAIGERIAQDQLIATLALPELAHVIDHDEPIGRTGERVVIC
jgi:hypothetical protein